MYLTPRHHQPVQTQMPCCYQDEYQGIKIQMWSFFPPAPQSMASGSFIFKQQQPAQCCLWLTRHSHNIIVMKPMNDLCWLDMPTKWCSHHSLCQSTWGGEVNGKHTPSSCTCPQYWIVSHTPSNIHYFALVCIHLLLLNPGITAMYNLHVTCMSANEVH